MRGALEGRGIRPVIIFLEARDDVLIRRFSETRHRHPLADERGIAASIALERAMIDPIRQQADVVIDTSELSLRELRERIFARLGDVQRSDRLAIQLISFGFKYGVPLEADLVLDVRFMKNPHYIEALRPNSGLTPEVRRYVLGQPIAHAFLAHLQDLLDLLVPAYVEEGKTRLTIAIGCTGGFHRSIVISEELAAWLRVRDFGTVARVPPGARAVNLRRWLTVGIGVKRWLLLSFVGLLLLALGVAHVLRQVTAALPPTSPIAGILDVLTLQFLPYELRGLVAGVARGHAVPRWRVSPRAGARRPVRAVGPRPADGRGHLPEALPRPRPACRGAGRRHRSLDPAPRAQGAHVQPDRRRHRGRRWRVVGRAARGAGHPCRRRHPQLRRGARGRRAADGPPPPVPVPGRAARAPGHDDAADPPAGDTTPARHGPRRARGRQPAARGARPARARRLRGGGARDEPRARRPRSRRARHGDGADAPRALDDGTEVVGQSRSRRRTAWTASGSRPRTSGRRTTRSGRSPMPR